MSWIRFPVLSLSLCLTLLTGCAATGDGGGYVGKLQARITGVGAESSVPGRSAFVQVEKIEVGGTRMVPRKLDPGEPIESESMVRVDIDQVVAGRSFNYNVIMGPPFGETAVAKGWVKQLVPPYYVGAGDYVVPAFYIDSGGALISWGYWPYFTNRWVSAAATGSTIALETDSSTNTSYVYLLSGSKVTITCLADTVPLRIVDITNENHFIALQDCATMPWPPSSTDLTTVPARQDFANRATAAMMAAAW